MKTISATVNNQNLVIAPSVISVAESVNAYAIKISYDAEWEGADKIVTFKGANGKAFAIKDEGTEPGVIIPWEVLRCPGKVSVGVMGYIGSEMKLATTGIYDRNTFIVLPAAFGLQEALTPTPDIYQKLLQTIDSLNGKIGNLNDLNTEAKNNLVAAINEVLKAAGVTEIKDDTGESLTGSVPLKTINNQSILGSGNIKIKGGGVTATVEGTTVIFTDESGVAVNNNTLIIGEE